MLSGPVLSENVASVSLPTVDAPFMMVKSQKVCKGLSVTACDTVRTILLDSRVPKPLTAAHYALSANTHICRIGVHTSSRLKKTG